MTNDACVIRIVSTMIVSRTGQAISVSWSIRADTEYRKNKRPVPSTGQVRRIGNSQPFHSIGRLTADSCGSSCYTSPFFKDCE